MGFGALVRIGGTPEVSAERSASIGRFPQADSDIGEDCVELGALKATSTETRDHERFEE